MNVVISEDSAYSREKHSVKQPEESTHPELRASRHFTRSTVWPCGCNYLAAAVLCIMALLALRLRTETA